MVVIGGLDPTEETDGDREAFNASADPWTQGLGVFDMTSLQWKSSYTADAGPYMPANIIAQYYGQGK